MNEFFIPSQDKVLTLIDNRFDPCQVQPCRYESKIHRAYAQVVCNMGVCNLGVYNMGVCNGRMQWAYAMGVCNGRMQWAYAIRPYNPQH